MGNLFKFLFLFAVLFAGSMPKGFAVSGKKTSSAFSLTASAHQKGGQLHHCHNAVPVFKKGHLQAESLFHSNLLELDDDDDDNNHYRKLLASLPAALPERPFINLHLAPGFFHKPRKLLALRNRDARAYAGKPVYVLFGAFLI